jgi:hypothetical protein
LDQVLGEEVTGVLKPYSERTPETFGHGSAAVEWRGIELDECGGVRDWHGLKVATYNPTAMCLEYVQPLAIVVNPAAADGVTLVEFTHENDAQLWDGSSTSERKQHGSGTSLVCTPNHMLFVRRAKDTSTDKVPEGDGFHISQNPTRFTKVSASDVFECKKTAAESGSREPTREWVRFLGRAPNGVGQSGVDTSGLVPFDALAQELGLIPYRHDIAHSATSRKRHIAQLNAEKVLAVCVFAR